MNDRYNGLASDPDALYRERELNTPREIDPESDKPRPLFHISVTWEQLRKVIDTNPPFERSEK